MIWNWCVFVLNLTLSQKQEKTNRRPRWCMASGWLWTHHLRSAVAASFDKIGKWDLWDCGTVCIHGKWTGAFIIYSVCTHSWASVPEDTVQSTDPSTGTQPTLFYHVGHSHVYKKHLGADKANIQNENMKHVSPLFGSVVLRFWPWLWAQIFHSNHVTAVAPGTTERYNLVSWLFSLFLFSLIRIEHILTWG